MKNKLTERKKIFGFYPGKLRRKMVITLWVLFAIGFIFAVYKNFTAVDVHTVHERKTVKNMKMDTHAIENFVIDFVKIYYTWDRNAARMNARQKNLKNYFTVELQQLNAESVREDIPVSATVNDVRIWAVEPKGNRQFEVIYRVSQTIGEKGHRKTLQSAYEMVVYQASSSNMVIVQNPTMTSIPSKVAKFKTVHKGRSVDLMTSQKIDEFLTTFFKRYPMATKKELQYYMNGQILRPIGRSYVFSKIIDSTYIQKHHKVEALVTVKYLGDQTKMIQLPQFHLMLEKEKGNWRIVR